MNLKTWVKTGDGCRVPGLEAWQHPRPRLPSDHYNHISRVPLFAEGPVGMQLSLARNKTDAMDKIVDVCLSQ